MIWWFLGPILFAIGIFIIALALKTERSGYHDMNKVLKFVYNHSILFFIIAIICIFIYFTILICNFVILCEYNTFCTEFTLLKDYYENFDGTNHNNLYHTVDIIEANRELIKWQTNYLRYGLWTVIPASVMDIVPIGG